jgi:hypothetical protein
MLITPEPMTPGTITRSGRSVCKPARFLSPMRTPGIQAFSAAKDPLEIVAEDKYIVRMHECYELSRGNVESSEFHHNPYKTAFVGMGIGGGFINTEELHILKYSQAMKTPDKSKWLEAMENEHQRMIKHGVFEVMRSKDMEPGNKVIDMTCYMKKKANGVFRSRLVIRGFKQTPGLHYDPDSKSSPVIKPYGFFYNFDREVLRVGVSL